jgi:hypothetical protein
MNTDEKDKTRLNAISKRIIGAAFTVSNTFDVGFLEKNYENALTHEMRKMACLLLNFGRARLKMKRLVWG